jgi:DNA-directed RNA polymerase subunit H (RpoH/RPB5)
MCRFYHLIKDRDPTETIVGGLIIVGVGIKVGKCNLLKWIHHHYHPNRNHIIVLACDFSGPAVKAIEMAREQEPTQRIELIRRKSISWDKAKFCLISHYELLNSEQLKMFLKKRKLTIQQLPRMLEQDPMAIAFGFLPGDVVHCLELDSYRVIVKGNG